MLAFVASHSFSLYDDAYIYLRYLDNLLAGCGLRFNCADDPVEGFTSPLWLAILALGRALTPDVEALTQVLGAAALGLALTVTILTAASEGRSSPPLALALPVATALALGLDHYVALNAVSGLETAVSTLVVALLVRSVLREEAPRLRALVVLATLARPECALFVLALPLLPRARSVRYLAPVTIAIVIIVLARLLVFGDVVPNTYWAKSGGTAIHARLGAAYIGEALLDFPLMVLAPLCLFEKKRRSAFVYLLLVAGLWMLFFLRSGGDTFRYSRLLMPLIPSLTLLGLLGSVMAVQKLLAGRHANLAAAVALALAIGASARASTTHTLAPTHGFPNVRRWEAVGRYLAEHHPGRSIATVPIGAIGYHSGLHLIDLVGLTSPAIARAGRGVPPERLDRNWIAHERHNNEWVLDQAPDIIVMSKWRDHPWTVPEARAGFFAEWLLMREIKEGRAPYSVLDAEIAPGVFWLMFEREG